MNEVTDKISFLAEKLTAAKAVMAKVEGTNINNNRPNYTPNYAPNNIPQQQVNYVANDDVEDDNYYYSNEPDLISEEEMMARTNNGNFSGSGYKNINTSRMPKEIIQSFAERPAIDPTQPIGMELIVNKVQQATNKVQQATPKTQQLKQQIREDRRIVEEPKRSLDIEMIEYIVKKTVESVMEQLNKSTNISENIQIKIGDKTFGGKITTLKEIKTNGKSK